MRQLRHDIDTSDRPRSGYARAGRRWLCSFNSICALRSGPRGALHLHLSKSDSQLTDALHENRAKRNWPGSKCAATRNDARKWKNVRQRSRANSRRVDGLPIYNSNRPRSRIGMIISPMLTPLIHHRLLMKYGTIISASPAISGMNRTAFLP